MYNFLFISNSFQVIMTLTDLKLVGHDQWSTEARLRFDKYNNNKQKPCSASKPHRHMKRRGIKIIIRSII